MRSFFVATLFVMVLSGPGLAQGQPRQMVRPKRPVAAPLPAHRQWAVHVDVLIVNRHRWNTQHPVYNLYGELLGYDMTSSSMLWLTFWDRCPTFPGGWSPSWQLQARGWISLDSVDVVPCSTGWAVYVRQYRGGPYVVFAPELRVVDSPYDFEIRNRRLYNPIKWGE